MVFIYLLCLFVFKNLTLLRGHGGPLGHETCRLPHFLGSRLIDGGEVVSLTRRPHLYPREDYWYLFLLGVESTPGSVRPEGLLQTRTQLPHRDLNPRPSGLWHSTCISTIMLAL
jgi:hypothetical protein